MAVAMGVIPKAKKKDPESTYLCYCCGEEKKKSAFYISTDPFNGLGINPFCKICLEKIARNYNSNTKSFGDVTKKSLCNALERMDVPYLDAVWDASHKEVHDPNLVKPKTNMWAAYMKNIKLRQYNGLRWRDGDIFHDNTTQVNTSAQDEEADPEVMTEMEKNRKDIIRLIGYDPFEKEAKADKPLLYAQLIGYIDTSGDNEDMTRVLDSIEMVRGYLQLQKINDMSARAFANMAKNGQSGEIKNYMETKKKIADVISQLAEQSCISQKYNKNASKGENTFAGKIKKLKEINLREAELNAFDIGTCEGMRQVADISNASIIKQLHLDENDYTEMLATQREMISKLQEQAELKTEEARILLRENLDLKAYITSLGVDISEFLSADTILYSEEGDGDE